MIRTIRHDLFNRQRVIGGFRLICLLGVFISFCLVLANTGLGINSVKIENAGYGASLNASYPVMPQLASRSNETKCLQGDRTRKGLLIVFLVLFLVTCLFDILKNYNLRLLPGLHGIFQGNCRSVFLLIDLPPPSIQ
jgi:hypothetical protein